MMEQTVTLNDGKAMPQLGYGVYRIDDAAAAAAVAVALAAGYRSVDTASLYRNEAGVGRGVRNDSAGLDDIRAEVDRVSRKLGRRVKFLVGKPGLDGHSNGAEQIAVRRATPASTWSTRVSG